MTKALVPALLLLAMPQARADSSCARAHAECEAQRQTCNQNRRPVRNGHDPNAACDQMASARCAAAAQCDQQARAEERRERRERRRQEKAAAAYQAGYPAGQSTAATAPTASQRPDDDHPFWTGKDRGAAHERESDEPAWRPMDEDAPPAPAPATAQPAPSQPAAAPAPLSAEEIDSVTAATQDNVHVCLMESVGAEVPHLHISLGFTIDTSGRASGVSTQGIDGLAAHAEIASCIARVAGLWKFRAPPAEQPGHASYEF